MYTHLHEIPPHLYENSNSLGFIVLIDPATVRTLDAPYVLEGLELLLHPGLIRDYRSRLALVFDGYAEDTRPLYAIPELRRFVAALTEAFPYWFHFVPLEGPRLLEVLVCTLPDDADGNPPTPLHEDLPILFGDMMVRTGLLWVSHGITRRESSPWLQDSIDHFIRLLKLSRGRAALEVA